MRAALAAALLLLLAVPAAAQTWKAAFAPSPDHATARVVGYELLLTPTGGVAIAPALALNKPAPVANVITVDVTAYVDAQAPGTYTGQIRVIGPGGMALSTVGPSFQVTLPAPLPAGPPTIIRSAAARADVPFRLGFEHAGDADAYTLRRDGTIADVRHGLGDFEVTGLAVGAYEFDVVAVYGSLSLVSAPLIVVVT